MASLGLGESEIAFTYMGGACVVLALPGYTLVFDPADYLVDEDIYAMKGSVITLYSHSLDDHFHARTAMKLVEMKGSLIIGTREVCDEVKDFVPSTRMAALKPRKGIRIGRELKVFAIEGRHEVSVNVYYVVFRSTALLYAGDTGYVQLSRLKVGLAFLPAGGGSPVASPQDAAKMALELKPKYAVPIHCEPGEAEKFAKLVVGEVEALIPVPQEPYKLSL